MNDCVKEHRSGAFPGKEDNALHTSSSVRARRVDVDVLRVLGAIFVVIYHFGVFSAKEPLGLYARSLFACCVPLFFFVSGVLYAKRDFTWQDGLNKAGKLMALTVLWALIIWPIRAVQSGVELAPNLYAAGVLTLQQYLLDYLWFLPALAIVYLLLPVFCALRDDNRRLFDSLVAGVILLIFGIDLLGRLAKVAGLYFHTEIFNKVMYFLRLFNPLSGIHGFALAYVLAGMAIGLRDDSEKCGGGLFEKHPLIVALIAPLGLVAYALVVRAFGGEEIDPTFGGYACITTFLLVIALYALAHKLSLSIGVQSPLGLFVVFVGGNSFAVYLMHTVFGVYVNQILTHASSGAERVLVGVGLSFAVVILLACVGALLRRTKPGRWMLRV